MDYPCWECEDGIVKHDSSASNPATAWKCRNCGALYSKEELDEDRAWRFREDRKDQLKTKISRLEKEIGHRQRRIAGLKKTLARLENERI